MAVRAVQTTAALLLALRVLEPISSVDVFEILLLDELTETRFKLFITDVTPRDAETAGSRFFPVVAVDAAVFGVGGDLTRWLDVVAASNVLMFVFDAFFAAT